MTVDEISDGEDETFFRMAKTVKVILVKWKTMMTLRLVI